MEHLKTTTIIVYIVGPVLAERFGRKRSCLNMATVPHRYRWADLTMNRAYIAEYIYNFVSRVDRNATYKTKFLQCDNALEIIALRRGLEKIGIDLKATSVCTAEFNGLTERANRSLLNKIRSMKPHTYLSNQYWDAQI